jgi:hypothetical protein
LVNSGADKDEALTAACDAPNSPEIILDLIAKGARLFLKPNEYLNTHLYGSSIAFSPNEALKAKVVSVTNGRAFSELFEDCAEGSGSCLLAACHEASFPYVSSETDIESYKKSYLSAIDFMLRSGADPNVFTVSYLWNERSCNLASTLGFAIRSKNEELITLLKKYSAKLPKDCNLEKDNAD